MDLKKPYSIDEQIQKLQEHGFFLRGRTMSWSFTSSKWILWATRCFEAGIPPKTVQVLLGHATLDMTMNLYTHVLEDKKEEALVALNDYYFDIEQQKEINIEDSFRKAVLDSRKVVSFG